MTDWTAGYVADVGYTYGYYPELNPLRVQLAFLSAGLAFPESGSACELGFGQGLSTNIHAATSVTKWVGTDFNPSQAAFAQDLASVTAADARLFDESFAEFCARQDLQEFDFIGLHGIWSWVSDANREIIVDFVRRKLKVGGVLYVSYNTQPGWAAMVPMRHLLTEHVEALGAPGQGIVKRIDEAIDFVDGLLAVNPAYSRANPSVVERMKSIGGQNRNYLAHEYFNRDWQPMPFAEMNHWLASAKLTYACSANYLDHLDVINLTAEQQTFLRAIPDSVFRETVRDFMVNQQFRRDYWVRGARPINAVEQTELLRKQRIVLVRPRDAVTLNATGLVGEATFAEEVYGPILDILADHAPKSLAQIEQAVTGKGINFSQVLEVAFVLAGKGDVVSALANEPGPVVLAQCERFNQHVMDKARSGGELSYLASPLTGGAMPVGRLHQLFLLSKAKGGKKPDDWASFAWETLSGQDLKLVKDGRQLSTSNENLAELAAQSKEFHQKWLPIMKALGISK
jgi:SAM-dependent methyltransferase